MIVWTRAFQDEIGESANDTERRVDRALATGQIWLWDQNGDTTSMAVGRDPAQGVVRLSGVYTPPSDFASCSQEDYMVAGGGVKRRYPSIK
jgi:predicted GNAT family acetyltransferase